METNENSLIRNLKEVNDFRVWRIKKNTQTDEIFPKINHNLFIIKTYTNNILDEKKRKNK